MSLSRMAVLASDRRVHRAFHWLHLHELQLRQWQMEMIAIPAPPFEEGARARWFLDRFRELGLTDVRLDEAGNALGVRGASNVRGCVLLSAHLDTVFPSTTDCTPREDGPRILAPGACDNAAGLTALLGLAACMKYAELSPACPVLFAANVGEEGAGDLRGMRHLFGGAHGIAAALALEGGGNATVVDRALGGRRFRITISGPGGHSWADAALPNPIFALSEALAALSRIELPRTPRTSLHCGTISGGTSVNSIPESATADIDLRSVSATQLGATEAEMLGCIRSAVRAANAFIASPQQLKLEISLIGDRPAAELANDSPLYKSLLAVDRHLGIQTEARIGSTDANLPLSLGVPALAKAREESGAAFTRCTSGMTLPEGRSRFAAFCFTCSMSAP